MSSNLGRVVVGVGVGVGWQRGGVAGWWEGKKRRSTMSLVNLDCLVLLDVERMCVYIHWRLGCLRSQLVLTPTPTPVLSLERA